MDSIFSPLFNEIDCLLTSGRVTVAIDGGSASGKTTLAELFKERYDCTVFHMDDFFLRPEQRTKERLSEAGGNVDRERFLSEVLIPLKQNSTVCYRKFNCSAMQLGEPVTVVPKKLTVIEGAYSMHPELAPYYDYSVFLKIDEEYQKERIMKRNSPELAKRFFDEWIPLENLYFEKMGVRERCNLIFEIKRQNV